MLEVLISTINNQKSTISVKIRAAQIEPARCHQRAFPVDLSPSMPRNHSLRGTSSSSSLPLATRLPTGATL
jgi:hypothetical protein